MESSRALENFEPIVEKIIFKEDELEELKTAIKNFAEEKIGIKELKRLLLKCRSRMVKEITEFTSFYAERKIKVLLKKEESKSYPSLPSQVESKLRDEINEKNEFLEIVAKRVNLLVSELNNEDSSEQTKQP